MVPEIGWRLSQLPWAHNLWRFELRLLEKYLDTSISFGKREVTASLLRPRSSVTSLWKRLALWAFCSETCSFCSSWSVFTMASAWFGGDVDLVLSKARPTASVPGRRSVSEGFQLTPASQPHLSSRSWRSRSPSLPWSLRIFSAHVVWEVFFFFLEVLLIPRKMWSHLLIKTVLLLPLSLSQRVNRRKVSVAQRGAQLSSGSFAANINSI